jgi:NAD(P)-dependent dehydrogenase (short-subunit alcohol dehydrogenase family)
VSTAVITGANVGIGFETAKGLATAGSRVVLACRDLAKAHAAAVRLRAEQPGAVVEAVHLDLSDLASVDKCAREISDRFPDTNLLINNAGGMQSERTVTKQGFESVFGVNHLAHFLFTDRLLPVLSANAPSRVITLASGAHAIARHGIRWDDLQSERSFKPFEVYGRSKLANVLFARELARRIEGSGVLSVSCHPGAVDTEFGKGGGEMGGVLGWLNRLSISKVSKISPAKGAETSLHLALAPASELTEGGYYAKSRLKKPSKHGADSAAARRLWDESAKLVTAAGYPVT